MERMFEWEGSANIALDFTPFSGNASYFYKVGRVFSNYKKYYYKLFRVKFRDVQDATQFSRPA